MPADHELTFLRNYRRITPGRACEETKRMTVAPNLSVWVYANGGWASLDRRLISRLWYSDDPHRSLCHLLFRNVLRLSASQYARLKTQLVSGQLSGMYKGPNNSYAIVVDLERDADAKRTAIASGLGLITTGVVLGGLYRLKGRFTRGDNTARVSVSTSPKSEYYSVETGNGLDSYQNLSGEKSSRSDSEQEAPGVDSNYQEANLPAEVSLSKQNQPKFEILLDDNFFKRFPKEDYNVDACVKNGTSHTTSLLMLAFYYFKILSVDEQNDIYLHLDLLPDLDYLSRTDWNTFKSKRQAFQAALNTFISSVPNTVRLGITLLRTVDRHSTLLIFDVRNNRLEYYDSNGRGVSEKSKYGEHATLYNYFVRNLSKIRRLHPKVCKVWSSDKRFQGNDGSCAMWSTVFGICRMSGIERSHLPSDIVVVKNISRSILNALWNTCQFQLFANTPFSKNAAEDALRDCNVEQADIESIRALVMENPKQDPIPIPNDVDICGTPEEESEQKIDCQDVVVDTYKTPLNPDQIKGQCVKADKITFRGSPSEMPEHWFSLTNRIVLKPRSVYVDLNMFFKISNAMEKHPNVHVEADVGIIHLNRLSVLDRPHLIPRLSFNRVLIEWTLPPEKEFVRKVKLLRMMTTPHMLLKFTQEGASDPEWGRKTHPLLQHFVLDDGWYSKRAPWSDFLKPFIAKDAVSFSLEEFKQKESGPIESPQTCVEMTFERPLHDDDVKYFKAQCKGKIESITFTCDIGRSPLSLSSLTDRLNLKIVTSKLAAESIQPLLQSSDSLWIHIEAYRGSTDYQFLQRWAALKPRLAVDRWLLAYVPPNQAFFDTSLLLAQTVFVTIRLGAADTEIERALKMGVRYFYLPPGLKVEENHRLTDIVQQRRVVRSFAEFDGANAPKNKIYPWIKSDEVTFDIEPSPPTDREIEEFQAMCPQVRRSNVKDMSNEKIILTMANMTTDTLNVQHVNFNNDYPLIARVLDLQNQPRLVVSIELAELDMEKGIGEILATERLRISKMIVRKQPATKLEYDRILGEISPFTDTVYQYVENGVDIDWLDAMALHGFVVDPMYDYQPLLQLLTNKNINPRLFDIDLRPLQL